MIRRPHWSAEREFRALSTVRPTRRVIAVDVDGTLLVDGRLNERLIAWCRERHAEGFELFCWSARGRQHAQRAVELAGLADMFVAVLAKPGYVVDDAAWTWIKFTRAIHPGSV
ncbi:MAG: hypothetical protein IT494_07430 [Gammaproteobacteria bacterium]|nr:hypothetical protein [Gammaproteobacteria bacterium]